MTSPTDITRVLLAGVRLTMGSAGLLVPDLVIRRLGIDPASQPAMRYPLRMFGIRTVLIGADLLSTSSSRRQHAELVAPVVHGSDTVAALLARRRGDLSPRAGAVVTAISAVNLALALVTLASRPDQSGARRSGPGCSMREPRWTSPPAGPPLRHGILRRRDS
ncbi:conserved protein of unknown function [Modestobacter italicus]|uniref:DUF4267 domain-containing protein n=1 Tax=Modestobacter italicus (strain DSM 44449 / CECT 9708 / BC 501) TaxID=2732864 RepID=I4EX28_MODI5|nr:hypothetical protein [Modestobacter marinus]CCH87941.1 conserved protein of unknown function [Modestobacter marinus]